MKKGQKKPKTSRRGQRGDDGDVALYWKQPKAQIHQFTRLVGANDIVKFPADSGYAVPFTLADLPGYTEFVSLFDQYRLDWVDYMFILKSSTVTNFGPTIYFAVDHDDSSAPSFNAMLEAQDTQIVTFGTDRTTVKFRVYPNALRQVYKGLTPGFERAPVGTWLDCANADIPHYGVKYYIQNYNSGSANGNLLSVVLRYHVSFKETI